MTCLACLLAAPTRACSSRRLPVPKGHKDRQACLERIHPLPVALDGVGGSTVRPSVLQICRGSCQSPGGHDRMWPFSTTTTYHPRARPPVSESVAVAVVAAQHVEKATQDTTTKLYQIGQAKAGGQDLSLYAHMPPKHPSIVARILFPWK